jgi:hypothetical protein
VLIEARARRLEAAGLRAALPHLRSQKTVAVVLRHLAQVEASAAELERKAEDLAGVPAKSSPAAPNRPTRR